MFKNKEKKQYVFEICHLVSETTNLKRLLVFYLFLKGFHWVSIFIFIFLQCHKLFVIWFVDLSHHSNKHWGCKLVIQSLSKQASRAQRHTCTYGSLELRQHTNLATHMYNIKSLYTYGQPQNGIYRWATLKVQYSNPRVMPILDVRM